MPHPDAILDSAAAIAQAWWSLAIVWHLFFGGLVVVATRWTISRRTLGWLLVPPLASVSVLAFVAGNPVNGGFFATLSLALAVAATRLPRERTRLAPPFALITGLVLFAFGWLYPHFLDATHWAEYAVAAPLGLLPCPTLSALIGVVLMFGVYRSRSWAGTIAGAGVIYGILGVFWLGVTIDLLLLAGAVVLWAFSTGVESRRSVHATEDERIRALPGDELVSAPIGSLTHVPDAVQGSEKVRDAA